MVPEQVSEPEQVLEQDVEQVLEPEQEPVPDVELEQ